MSNSKGITIAALVLGIVSCVLPWYGVVVGIISIACAIVGLVLAIKARKAVPASKMALIALILCIVGLVLSVIGTIACGICVCAAAQAVENGGSAELESIINDASNALQ